VFSSKFQLSRMPEVWVRRCFKVIGTFGYWGFRTGKGSTSLTSASRDSSPCSTSCITAQAVTGFETEAIRKRVSLLTGIFSSRLAHP
jgi:hypothetical protein